MKPGRILALAFLVAAVSLSGCSDAPAPQAEDDEAFEDLDLQATSTTGVIRGVVVDTTITPIAGARVDILGTSFTTTSDMLGRFAFEQLEPGTYFLQVKKAGYGTVQQSVEVVAGVKDPRIIKVLIERTPGTEPFATYIQFEGYVGCSAQAANFVSRNLCSPVDPDKGQVIDFGSAQMPHIVQVELLWDHTQPIGERLSIIEYSLREGGSAQRIGNVWGPSPQVCRVTRDAVCDNGDGTGGGGTGLNETEWEGRVEMRVYANCFNTCVPGTALGLGVVLQQSYQQFGSAFYNIIPPEAWRFIDEGPYPIPPS